MKMQLYDYQHKGIEWLIENNGGLLADQVGLGKTIQTLEYIYRQQPSRVLVLCPAILKWQWKDEVEKWLPNMRVIVIDGNAQERRALWKSAVLGATPDQRPTIVIANYELLLRDIEDMAVIFWSLIVADEATRLANPWTKTYKALYKVRSEVRIALTGTPLINRPTDFWGILNWCYPGILGKYRVFLDQYAVRNVWGGIWGFRNIAQLRKRIQPLMIRRTREEVLTELPEKTTSDVPIQLSEKEWALYDKIRKELLFEIEAMDISKIEQPTTIQNTLTKMLRLRQAANSLELLGDNKESSKIEALKELLPIWLNGERKAILFTFFSGMADLLERELKELKPLKITGEVTKGREDIIKTFNEGIDNRLLIMTEAGAFGLNIQAASVVVHCDQAWSLAKMEQRIGRAHRLGQTQKVFEYNLICKKTIDEYILRVLRKKQKMSDDLLGDGDIINHKEIKEILTYGTS